MNFETVKFKSSYGLSSQLPTTDRPEIVFSGRSNVGKSSLINKLCNRKSLARTSAAPGKTATINYYECAGVHLVDLPGYGYAKVSRSERERWDKLINSYFAQNRGNALLLQLLDCRHAISKDDETMLAYIAHYALPFVAVLTKQDKLKKSEIEARRVYFEELLQPYNCRKIIFTSTLNTSGIEELKAEIEAFLKLYSGNTEE